MLAALQITVYIGIYSNEISNVVFANLYKTCHPKFAVPRQIIIAVLKGVVQLLLYSLAKGITLLKRNSKHTVIL
ncbi:hypothetical protein KJ966_27065 [bacterium]|nr:hypothetical protein [bacterium]